MLKSLIGISAFISLNFNHSNAQINLESLNSLLPGAQSGAQPSSPTDTTQGLITSVVQQQMTKDVVYPGANLTKQGAWYIFQNGDWKPISQNDNLSNMNIALLIHDLIGDKTNLHTFASWFTSIPKDHNSYNPMSPSTNSSSEGYFQAILAFEYPSTKNLEDKNGQVNVISSIAEAFAPQLILGTKNVKSLTIFAHGVGGLISRYALQKEFPDLISKNESDYKDIFKKIRLITLGTPHTGIPSQVNDIAYKSFIKADNSNALTSALNQQATNYLQQNQTNLLGQQTSGILGLVAPGLLPNSLIGGLSQQNPTYSFPVIKEIEPNSPLLNSLNGNPFSYADQTDYVTIAGNKSTEFQIGIPNTAVEVGTAIQTAYGALDSTITSDGLVSQYSANAKELEKYCVAWAKNSNDRSYVVSANHTELMGTKINQNFSQQVAPVLIKIFNLPHSSLNSASASGSDVNVTSSSMEPLTSSNNPPSTDSVGSSNSSNSNISAPVPAPTSEPSSSSSPNSLSSATSTSSSTNK